MAIPGRFRHPVPFLLLYNSPMSDLAVNEQLHAIPRASVYTTNAWLVFGVICFVSVFFNWYLQQQVLTDQVYTYSLGGQVNPDKLAAFLQGQHRMAVLSYLLIPAVLLVKMVLVTLCLLTGLLLTSQKVSFSTLFRIVLFAETAFVASTLLRLLLLAFSHNVESLGQYMAFAPLSLFNFFHAQSVPNWLVYPLQTLDVFQALYIYLLAKGLSVYFKRSVPQSVELVLGSYGVGLFTMMILFAFISITFNP
jgi:hypothetical protein